MTPARPDRGGSPEQERESRHLDDLIDEAGKESFPASDPMAITPARRPSPEGGEQGDDRQHGTPGTPARRPAD
jgi:hypothetical protein